MTAQRTGRSARGGTGAPLVVIGDALLDRDVEGSAERLCPDAPVPVLDQHGTASRPGGAGLAAALAAADGTRDVTLVTALADDTAGRELRALLIAAGVEVVDLGLAGATPEKVRLRATRRTLLRLDRGGPGGAVGPASAAARAAIGWASAILVADYGRGVAAEPGLRAVVAERAAAGVPVAWDPHPRGPAPVRGVALVTPNEREAAGFAGEVARAALSEPEAAGSTTEVARTAPNEGEEEATPTGEVGQAARNEHVAAPRTGDIAQPAPNLHGVIASAPAVGSDGLRVAAARASALRERWGAGAVCVTRAERGALLDGGGDAPLVVPAPPVAGGDPCGAGDRFAACAAARLADGATAAEAVVAAVAAASAFVAAGGAAAAHLAALPRSAAPATSADAAPPTASPEPALATVAVVRAAGGVVVATGGCFDLLHTGHVETLQAARQLGDCLVVCLNSDASVRRLKGPERPLVRQADRAAVLSALGCVDVVVVFDEDTPEQILDRLRPDVWCKGGDYAGVQLPEASVLARWGGQAVVLPHRAGASTTRLIEEAVNRAAS